MKHLLKASVTAILIVFTVTFVVIAIDSIGNPYTDILIILFMAGVAALVSSIVIFFWAIPIHLLLSRIKKTHPGWYIAAVVIPCFAFIFVLKPFGRDLNLHLLQQALFCTSVGCLGAVGFWYFAVHQQRESTQ
ncbi:MAG: hypothetical protein AB8B87_02275 [Granulosicoccus sp.]